MYHTTLCVYVCSKRFILCRHQHQHFSTLVETYNDLCVSFSYIAHSLKHVHILIWSRIDFYNKILCIGVRLYIYTLEIASKLCLSKRWGCLNVLTLSQRWTHRQSTVFLFLYCLNSIDLSRTEYTNFNFLLIRSRYTSLISEFESSIYLIRLHGILRYSKFLYPLSQSCIRIECDCVIMCVVRTMSGGTLHYIYVSNQIVSLFSKKGIQNNIIL